MDHAKGAGRPLTLTTNENSEQAQQMMVDRCITVDELAYSLQISHGSAYEIIHDKLGFRKVGA